MSSIYLLRKRMFVIDIVFVISAYNIENRKVLVNYMQ